MGVVLIHIKEQDAAAARSEAQKAKQEDPREECTAVDGA